MYKCGDKKGLKRNVYSSKRHNISKGGEEEDLLWLLLHT